MKEVKKLIREVIPVIIGILVALLINNWNEDRKSEKYLNQIFTSITKELDESSIDIQKSISKQQVLLDTLQKYMHDETFQMIDVIKKAGGIYGPSIKNYSWKALANTNIELIEFEKLSALSEIDQSKKIIELKLEKSADFVFQNIKSTAKEKKEMLMLLTQELVSSEKYLLLEINEFLKK